MTQTGSRAILNPTREHPAASASGYPMLLLALLTVPAGFVAITQVPVLGGWAVAGLVLAIVVLLFVIAGFYLIAPNQAYAIQLFGSYKGTDRKTGLRWVLPWLMRKKISVRVHNITSDRLKVNDLRGNPVEIAANVVWRVTDSAQALFDVDDYKESSTSRSKARCARSAAAIPMTISNTRRSRCAATPT